MAEGAFKIHPFRPRQKTIELVTGYSTEDGTFLVHNFKTEDNWVLCVMYKTKPTFHKIKLNSDGFLLVNDKQFGECSTIGELVKQLGEKQAGWPVPLANPVPSLDESEPTSEVSKPPNVSVAVESKPEDSEPASEVSKQPANASVAVESKPEEKKAIDETPVEVIPVVNTSTEESQTIESKPKSDATITEVKGSEPENTDGKDTKLEQPLNDLQVDSKETAVLAEGAVTDAAVEVQEDSNKMQPQSMKVQSKKQDEEQAKKLAEQQQAEQERIEREEEERINALPKWQQEKIKAKQASAREASKASEAAEQNMPKWKKDKLAAQQAAQASTETSIEGILEAIFKAFHRQDGTEDLRKKLPEFIGVSSFTSAWQKTKSQFEFREGDSEKVTKYINDTRSRKLSVKAFCDLIGPILRSARTRVGGNAVLLRRDQQDLEEREKLRKRHEEEAARKKAIADEKKAQKEAETESKLREQEAEATELKLLNSMPLWKRALYLKKKKDGVTSKEAQDVVYPKRTAKTWDNAITLLKERRAKMEEEEKLASLRSGKTRKIAKLETDLEVSDNTLNQVWKSMKTNSDGLTKSQVEAAKVVESHAEPLPDDKKSENQNDQLSVPLAGLNVSSSMSDAKKEIRNDTEDNVGESASNATPAAITLDSKLREMEGKSRKKSMSLYQRTGKSSGPSGQNIIQEEIPEVRKSAVVPLSEEEKQKMDEQAAVEAKRIQELLVQQNEAHRKLLADQASMTNHLQFKAQYLKRQHEAALTEKRKLKRGLTQQDLVNIQEKLTLAEDAQSVISNDSRAEAIERIRRRSQQAAVSNSNPLSKAVVQKKKSKSKVKTEENLSAERSAAIERIAARSKAAASVDRGTSIPADSSDGLYIVDGHYVNKGGSFADKNDGTAITQNFSTYGMGQKRQSIGIIRTSTLSKYTK